MFLMSHLYILTLGCLIFIICVYVMYMFMWGVHVYVGMYI